MIVNYSNRLYGIIFLKRGEIADAYKQNQAA